MTRALRCFLLTFSFALCATYTGAQVQTGTPAFASFGGGPETINLGNLNTHWTFPILHKPGRGMNFNYDLGYDSSVWYPAGVSGSQVWLPTWNWGLLGQTQVATGYVTYAWTQGKCNTGTKGNPNWIYYNRYHYTTYYDKFGRAYWIGAWVDDNDGSCPYQDPYTATVSLGAGSGYSIYVDAQPSSEVYPPKGGTITPPLQSGNGSGSGNDRNGNIISASGGVFTDTLGTTALTIAGSGTPSSPVTFTYPAPSGANASYSMKYTSFTVQTNFHCSGVTEYAATVISLPSEIDLPDGTKYTLTYETTPNDTHNPHYVTGRLASVGLPTGGTISYSYSGGGTGVNGITCADGSAATITRTTPDGAWTYARSQVSGTHWQTKVTTPPDSQNQGSIGDDTLIDFQQDSTGTSNYYETQRRAYQGSSSSGTLLRTSTICFNTNTTNCSTTAVSSPITQRNLATILPGSTNLQSQSIYKYNSNGSLSEQDDYDFGSGAPGSLLKKTAMTFASLGNITSFRQQVTVTNGSGATVSQVNYNYDETAVQSTTGTPQHTGVSGSRGNLTSTNYYTNGTTYLTKKMSYFDTGVAQTMTDVNGAQVAYNFHDATSTCGNAFPTSVSEPLSLSKSMTWNCAGGVQLTAVDENNQTTTTTFNDPYFWRPASVTDPSSAAANMTYTGQTQKEASLSFNSGNSSLDPVVTSDGLGRPHVSQVREAPGSTNFDSTETDFDSFGRVSRVTLPYVGTVGQTNSSAPAQTKTYDALNRTLSVSDNSGGSRTFSYSQNDVYVTRGPAPSGENTKRRQEEFDGLGRLTSVCEITAGTTPAPAGTCAQNSSQTGYWTKYTFDALGRLTSASQNAQSSNPQGRTYQFDLLGRLTSETNPESSTTSYVYDTDSTCGTSNGDLVKRTDAVGNVTCTAFDALHRPTAITYTSGNYAPVTPAKHFVYDSATVNSVVMTYVKGRLAETYTCTGTCTSKITDEGFSYTVRGEPSDVYQSTPNSGGYFHVNQTYWANSALKQLTAPGIPTITYTTDGEGRPYQVSASSGQNPVTNAAFNSASLPTSVTYGSSDSDAFSFDSNTNRITQYKFTVNSQSLIGALTWNANHTLASQNITDPFYSPDAQNCSYSHDDLTRLASVSCGSVWSQTFSYDSFGNISKSGTQSFQPIYKDTNGNTTNRFVSIPGTTVSYDANGSVLSDGSHTYSMDSAGKTVSVDSVNLTFDAMGRMVEQNRSGTYTQIVYSPGGAKLALMNGQTLQKGLIPLPGGGQAVYNSSGLLYYGHSDHLGSIKFGSTPSRTTYFDLAYAPFGEVYATTGTTDPSFTSQRQDTVAGLFDFPAREYSAQGRWPSPDPSGLANVSLSDPQTLNRYAYVRNNPLVMIDPQGLGDVTPGCDDTQGGEDEDQCSGKTADPNNGGGDASGSDPASGGDPTNGGADCTEADPTCGGSDPGTSDPGPDPGQQNQACDPGPACVTADPLPNVNGTCVYMNASGTAADSIDPNSNALECTANNGPGGLFLPGLQLNDQWRITEDPDSGKANILMPQRSCAQLGWGATAMGAVLGGGTARGTPKGTTTLLSSLNAAAAGYSYYNLCSAGMDVITDVPW